MRRAGASRRHPSRGDGRRPASRCRCTIASGLGPAAARSARRSGCSACSRSRSGCRSSRSPPTARCCRPGSRAPITRRRRTRIFSMPPAMSEASWRCSSYPVAIEPFVRLGDQTWLWTVGFYVLILLIAGCGVLLLRSPDALPAAAPTTRDASAAADLARRARSGGLAAVPSGLLIAVTAHISTDVAAVPLLWVGAARALSPDLRDRVPTPADHSAPAGRRGAAGLRRRRSSSCSCFDADQLDRRR